MINNFLHIALRATNPDKGADRGYVLCLGKDLFGDWSVMLNYGRYGRKGTVKYAAFATKQEAYGFINAKLKRRLSAFKRIGCEYQATFLEGESEFKEFISLDLMERFFQK